MVSTATGKRLTADKTFCVALFQKISLQMAIMQNQNYWFCNQRKAKKHRVTLKLPWTVLAKR